MRIAESIAYGVPVLPISETSPLLLASGSPRRREILSLLRIPYRARAANAPEDLRPGDTPETFLLRVVSDKLTAGRALERQGAAAVLVADTIVVLDEEILGKPIDVADAERLVSRLAGRTHTVFTRYAFCTWEGEPTARTVSSRVSLAMSTPAALRKYARTGEGLDKAGAYAVQGIGAFLVETIHGSYTNVVGLPAAELVKDLSAAGLLTNYPPDVDARVGGGASL